MARGRDEPEDSCREFVFKLAAEFCRNLREVHTDTTHDGRSALRRTIEANRQSFALLFTRNAVSSIVDKDIAEALLQCPKLKLLSVLGGGYGKTEELQQTLTKLEQLPFDHLQTLRLIEISLPEPRLLAILSRGFPLVELELQGVTVSLISVLASESNSGTQRLSLSFLWNEALTEEAAKQFEAMFLSSRAHTKPEQSHKRRAQGDLGSACAADSFHRFPHSRVSARDRGSSFDQAQRGPRRQPGDGQTTALDLSGLAQSGSHRAAANPRRQFPRPRAAGMAVCGDR